MVLTYIASKGNLPYGLALLWTYAVGHCVLVVVAGTSMAWPSTSSRRRASAV